MPNKTISLSTPITTHEGQVDEIVLREPKAGDFFALGEPYTWVQPEGGQPMPVMVPEIVRGYLERCMVRPGAEMLPQIGLADAMKLEEAISGFFGAARRAASPLPATSSSGNIESAPQASGSN